MDGDGSIQVNHWRKRNLQYRLVIKLSNLPSNVRMLNQIRAVIGGRVVIGETVKCNPQRNFVLWVMDNKNQIQSTVQLFEKYPPLTTRLTCCLKFLKKCLIDNDVNLYLQTRNDKYIERKQFYSITNPFSKPDYFNSWVSGFIEAEGCFSIRANGSHSFSIAQKDDYYLLVAIQQHFGILNLIRPRLGPPYKNKALYSLEVYRKAVLQSIIDHCETYPLMGAKYDQLRLVKPILFNSNLS
uniref:LAGLIDADG endonuclease n=1 Tax=Synchytrium endobioticum TaxID=286115 RepID=A0A4P8NM89_9FUNG|nr:LAGLIDADG endonuclease [Synchytrium endobioticum]QCQ68498.1 LAGLIDADG endonuclease [Synchytrium endobioticum]QCQ68517.1 LAGLIDADG endonuclease [Synchytrium endobioticum]QCQ68650.1 LAGLIDADG endonuclease [Synchytrium endobioticum]QCQ68897.1 LAGLIDADG endonuclease [Synchytrium endobioticum]